MDKSLGTFINPFSDAALRKIYAEVNCKLNELANMSYEDRHAYELSLKYYRDFINVVDTAKKDAREEREIEIVKTMLKEGFDIKIIAKITGLTEAMILSQRH